MKKSLLSLIWWLFWLSKCLGSLSWTNQRGFLGGTFLFGPDLVLVVVIVYCGLIVVLHLLWCWYMVGYVLWGLKWDCWVDAVLHCISNVVGWPWSRGDLLGVSGWQPGFFAFLYCRFSVMGLLVLTGGGAWWIYQWWWLYGSLWGA